MYRVQPGGPHKVDIPIKHTRMPNFRQKSSCLSFIQGGCPRDLVIPFHCSTLLNVLLR